MNVKRARVLNVACRAGIMVALLCGGLASVYGQQQTWTPIGFGGYWPESVRLLEQATFGPTPELVEHVNNVGTDGFLDEQLAAAMTPYRTAADAVHAPDRLHRHLSARQLHDVSAADAISSTMRSTATTSCASASPSRSARSSWSSGESTSGSPSWMRPYQQLLYADAFGNFRQLLEDVTLSAAMGSYLNMVNNKKLNPTTGVKPNENYAREMLQLFTIGLVMLNPDGTPQLDENGETIPTYDQATVEEFARVFTGWILAPAFGTGVPNYRDPMVVRVTRSVEVDHDTGSKHLLNGAVVPAGLSAQRRSGRRARQHRPVTRTSARSSASSSFSTWSRATQPGVHRADRGGVQRQRPGVRGDLQCGRHAPFCCDPEARGDMHAEPTLRPPARAGVVHRPGAAGAFMRDERRRAWHHVDAPRMGRMSSGRASVFNFYPPGYRMSGGQRTARSRVQASRLGDRTGPGKFREHRGLRRGSRASLPDRPLGTKLDLVAPAAACAPTRPRWSTELNGLLLHRSMSAADARHDHRRDRGGARQQRAACASKTAAYLMASSAHIRWNNEHELTRREFLAQGCAMGAATLALQRFGLVNASPRVGGYRALVCIFLFGGNDSNNMIIPLDDYAAYKAVRGRRHGPEHRARHAAADRAAERREHLRPAPEPRGAAAALERADGWRPSATSVRWSSRSPATDTWRRNAPSR